MIARLVVTALTAAALLVAPEGEAPAETTQKTATVSLHGRVLGAGDAPVPGATIRILPTPPKRDESEKKQEKKTVRVERPEPRILAAAEDGSFTVADLVGESFTVRVEARGYASFTQPEIPGGASLTFRLKPGVSLSGRVIDVETGEPVTGVEVTICEHQAARFGTDACIETATDDEGRFVARHLAGERAVVAAVSPRHAKARRNIRLAETGETREEILLSPGGRIAGTVVDASGNPIHEAQVSLTPIDRRDMLSWRRNQGVNGTTDEAGLFDLEGVAAPTRYRLFARKEGFAVAERGPIALEPGGDISDLAIVMTEGASIAVRLIDSDQQPVSGIELRLEKSEPVDRLESSRQSVGSHQIESVDDGRFVVRHLMPGTFDLRIQPADARDVEKAGLALADGQVTDLGTIVVDRGRSLAGTVTDVDGNPVEDATVMVSWRIERESRRRSATVDESGEYELGGLEDDLVRVDVRAKGFVTATLDDVEPGADDVDFTLERSGSVIGRVVIAGGRRDLPVTVRAVLESTKTPFGAIPFGREASKGRADADGRFELSDVAPGEYVIEANARGMKPGKAGNVTVSAGETTDAGTIRLEPGITLRGRVVGAATEQPVVGAGVTATTPGPMGFSMAALERGSADTLTGSDGAFELEGLEAGVRMVRVEHTSFSPAEARVDLVEGEDPPELVVRLTEGGILTGTVRGAGGEPVPGVRIMAMPGFNPSAAQFAMTHEDGVYRMERLGPGTYQVTRMPERPVGPRDMEMKSTTITEGETTVVDFDEESPVLLEGRVLQGDTPVANAALFFLAGTSGTFSPASMDAKLTQADEVGNYSIGLDHGGTYQVRVGRGGNGRGGVIQTVVELVVPEEPRVQRDIILRTAGIEGTVTSEDGEPVEGVWVSASRDGAAPGDLSQASVSRTDAGGAYAIHGLKNGTYRLTASAEGFAVAARYPVSVDTQTPMAIVDLTLERGEKVRGRVVDPAGSGVPGAMVYVIGESPSPQGMGSFTAADGAFEVYAAPGGAVDVVVVAGGWAPTATRGLRPGESEVVIRVSQGGRARVSVTENGNPVSGVQIYCKPDDPSLAAGVAFGLRLPRPTDANGVTVADLLAPGTYRVEVSDRPDLPPTRVEIAEGEQTVVHIPL